MAGTAFAIDPLGRSHVVWLGITPAERRLRELVRAAPASSPVAVDPAGVPAGSIARADAWPNPARGTAVLRLRSVAPRPPGTRALLYSVAGRRLAELDAAGDGAGSVPWDGLDTAGHRVPPGIVLVRVQDPAGATVAAGRFVWLP